MKPGPQPKDKNGNWMPTPEQKECVELLFTTKLNYKQICEKIKISLNTITSWTKNKNFVNYLQEQRAQNQIMFLPRIDNSVIKKAIGSGEMSMSAARTIYELRGEINNYGKEKGATNIQINLVSAIPRPTEVVKEAPPEAQLGAGN